ncbi:MAG: hypothetical protein RLY31_806 [Bacteroidota bacterium]|jgi:pantoate--beta-alanine ligase
MLLFKCPEALASYLRFRKESGDKIGFVPTMGALHEGHLSLVRRSCLETDLTVCSIFVNPTQFNEASDLSAYPSTPGPDLLSLYQGGCQVLFRPDASGIYPEGTVQERRFDLGLLETTMEGVFRPGHFQGVAQVVLRLLQIVTPDRLYMGLKDFQQCAVVGRLLRTESLPGVELICCPIVRESDGLAMSSRNVRIDPSLRPVAATLYQVLLQARERFHSAPVDTVRQEAVLTLAAAGFRPEYFSIVDRDSLQPVESPSDSAHPVACVAAWLGSVRLIDNLSLY